MRFLVVDDSAMMRRMIIKGLNGLGHTDVCEAGNGKEGLESLAAGSVDVVLTDWNMPLMSGLEFVKALRASDAGSRLPVLMITTNVSTDDLAEARAAGVSDFVGKPFTPDVLKEKIEKVLCA
jgi:two-component system chemotaxis response regulator CheY